MCEREREIWQRFQVKHLAFSLGQLSVSFLLFLKRKIIKKKLGALIMNLRDYEMLDKFPVDSGQTSKQENKRRENVILAPIIIRQILHFFGHHHQVVNLKVLDCSPL